MKANESSTATATLAPAAAAPTEQKKLSIDGLTADYGENKLHGKEVNAFLVERFAPMLDKVKGLAKIRLMVLLHLIAEFFPKHVWAEIASSGSPAEITARIRVAVRAIYREKAKHIASLTDEIGTDLDLLRLAVDERQNVPGGINGAEWVGYFLNVVPDKKTQANFALVQLKPELAKQNASAAKTPAGK